MSSLLTVEQHRARILDALVALPSESLPLAQAHGLTSATDARAAVHIPVFDNSAMDGFAVRSADLVTATAESPVPLEVVADLPAGSPEDPPLAPGQAARIMTGSAVPTDADAVVPVEHTLAALQDSLTRTDVTVSARVGQHIRRRGGDLAAGDVVVRRGEELTAFHLAALAAAGVARVAVHRRVRVAIVSTGSELVMPGGELRRGQIPESNGTLLAGLAAEAGAEVVHTARVADDPDAFGASLVAAADAGADVVVCTGGVSVGAYEVVRDVLEGDRVRFDRVAMQPGKPQGFGALDSGIPVFCLPGNPVSVAVSWETFVRPALGHLQGRRNLDRPVIRLPTSIGWRTPPDRRQYLPAAIDRSDPGRWTVAPATAGGSGSHLAGGLARAEAYAVIPAEVGSVAAGDLVAVMLVS
ncbi:molybdopterin molybdotransferase MoeA [Microbacterium sp. SSW1-59]|uniref:molybdopterin molybdotransferase MoeA n=1 Tax=Microbacterium xanthum TaxID=3079794 RepID=UPI002AD27545|nr:gephyrin-like molybdotransferase Glp [Microbacterium sp. SSW1-59]MDZ8200056.1 molybdopterin molybdotransferase MoeA [Microbacterium sp. SSW1-59]